MVEKYSKGKGYRVIAFCLACFANEEQTRKIRMTADKLKTKECKVVFFSTQTDLRNHDAFDSGEEFVFSLIEPRSYDAVVIWTKAFQKDAAMKELIDRCQRVQTPVITIDKRFEGCINLFFDYKESFRSIVEHMIRYHGHRVIDYMGGTPGNSFAEERLQVFKEVLSENGIPLEEDRIFYGDFSEAPCRKAMDRLLESSKAFPEAIICANDTMALTVCSYLKEHGYCIPQDVAVSGYDGIIMEQYNSPRITTSVINYDQLLDTIFQIVKEGPPENWSKETYLINNKMRVGSSCGCQEIETIDASAEMIRLKRELNMELRFDRFMNQIVANYGNADDINNIPQLMKYYVEWVGCKGLWLYYDKKFINRLIAKPREYIVEAGRRQEETGVREYIRYCYRQDKDRVSRKQATWDNELPNVAELLEKMDYMLILPLHLQEKHIGFAIIEFDAHRFWYTAFGTLCTSNYYILEMQKHRVQLSRVYMCDNLTGLYNRNGFYNQIERMMLENSGLQLGIISLDMDYLKRINDTYGHDEGDRAIRQIGSMIAHSIRNETAGRIGGDEFLIAFAEKNIEDRAREIIKSIKTQIREYNNQEHIPYEIHVSIGYYMDQIKGHSLDELMRFADHAMYETKRKHRKKQNRR